MLFWSEIVMPVESFIVVDLEQMRSTGRSFYWDVKAQAHRSSGFRVVCYHSRRVQH